jgi:hypothetical protein
MNVQSAAVRLHQPSEGILVACAGRLQQPALVHAVLGIDGRAAPSVLAFQAQLRLHVCSDTGGGENGTADRVKRQAGSMFWLRWKTLSGS